MEPKSVAAHGIRTYSPFAIDEQWKRRLANERAGLPRLDVSGANTSISLVWCPDSDLNVVEQRPRGSSRKQSELRLMYDLGYRGRFSKGHTGAASSASTPTRGTRDGASIQPPTLSSAHLRQTARFEQLAAAKRAAELTSRSEAADADLTDSMREQLTGVRAQELERVRLSRATELRKVGETFLHAGNLQQAREHFGRAERLLQMTDEKYAKNRAELNASVEYRMMGLPRGDSYL